MGAAIIMKQTFKKIFNNKIGKKILNLRQEIKKSLAFKKSYSQTGEDLILDFFLEGKKKGFYVDIGAYHPTYLSNTKLFYKKGWKGIQIEPNKKRAKLFTKERPDTVTLDFGVGIQESELDFYIFDADTLSTFSKESADEYCQLGHNLISVEKVLIKPLSMIFKEYVKNIQIDILSLDVEGYDLEVLKTNDWDKFRPSFIVLETIEYSKDIFDGKKLNQIYDPFLENIGYKKVADTHINTIYKDFK